MSLLLAPYTHAMRLGQGFNSYTQQICIDNAVVVDEQTPENVVTNDGTTMRIMVQKNGNPSAWTRQIEVIVSQPETAVLVENAKKAKAAVAIIEEELAAEDAEEVASSALPQAGEEEVKTEEKPAIEEPLQIEEAPETKDETMTSEGAEAEEKGPAEETVAEVPATEESGSVDQVADADEAREEVDAPVSEEGTAANLPVDSAKAATTKASGGRSSSTAPATKVIDKASVKPTQAKGDDDKVDQESAIANIQANASGDDKVDRDAIAANLRANTAKPITKKPVKRSASSDRARQNLASSPSGPPDRAAIRASLTGKAVEDPVTSAKDNAALLKQQEEEAELLREQRVYQKELLKQQRQDEADRRKEEREEQRSIPGQRSAPGISRDAGKRVKLSAMPRTSSQ